MAAGKNLHFGLAHISTEPLKLSLQREDSPQLIWQFPGFCDVLEERERDSTGLAGTMESPGKAEQKLKDRNGVNETQQLLHKEGQLVRTSSRMMARNTLTRSAPKLILVTVGLPARGKSFISKKIQRFLSWRGEKVEVFNVGNYRRQSVTGRQDANWFNNTQDRDKLAQGVMEHMIDWLHKGGDVAIFDATNTTRARRELLQERVTKFSVDVGLRIAVVFLESICTDNRVLSRNYHQKVLTSPDFKGVSYDDAVGDLKNRIENYKKVYETITDDEHCSYVKLFNLQSKVHANHIYGRLAKSLLPYLMSIHIGNRPIWLTRAGHCEEVKSSYYVMDNVPCIASRSAKLSVEGIEFAQRLGEWVSSQLVEYAEARLRDSDLKIEGEDLEGDGTDREDPPPADTSPPTVTVLTSTLPRAVQTARFINAPITQLSALNPLDKGEAYGITVDEMKEKMPEAWAEWERDPLHTRFPGGESYHDLMIRLEAIVTDIEQQTDPVLIVSHISALQVLYCYFLGVPIQECHKLSIPFHSVLELTPQGAGWDTKIIDLRNEHQKLQKANSMTARRDSVSALPLSPIDCK